MDVSVKITGLERLKPYLRELGNLDGGLNAPTRDALVMLQSRLREYPPPPAGSRYIRTYNLRHSWITELLRQPNGVLGQVASFGVPYNRYVMDDTRQAPVHQGRWHTVQSVSAEKQAEVQDIYSRYIDNELRKSP